MSSARCHSDSPDASRRMALRSPFDRQAYLRKPESLSVSWNPSAKPIAASSETRAKYSASPEAPLQGVPHSCAAKPCRASISGSVTIAAHRRTLVRHLQQRSRLRPRFPAGELPPPAEGRLPPIHARDRLRLSRSLHVVQEHRHLQVRSAREGDLRVPGRVA